MPQYKTKFRGTLSKAFPHLQLVTGSETDVVCSICGGGFSVGDGGKRSAKKHDDSAKHQKWLNQTKNTPSMSSFLASNDDKAVMKLQAKELTFAFHTGKHQIAGRVAACTSSLITEFFDSKFSGGATKTTKLITKVITLKFSGFEIVVE